VLGTHDAGMLSARIEIQARELAREVVESQHMLRQRAPCQRKVEAPPPTLADYTLQLKTKHGHLVKQDG